MGQGGIDVQRFLGDAPLLVRRQSIQRLHVVQPVRQLDKHDADVLGHGHQHLAQAFGIEAVGVIGAVGHGAQRVVDAAVQPGQLGHAVHQLGDFRAEAAGELIQRHVAVFHYVVKQGRGDGLFVQSQVGEVEGDFQGVGDVGFAGLPQLPVVGTVCEGIGVFDEAGGVLGQVDRHLFQKFAYSVISSYPKVFTPVC